jgi:hypothetical protein
LNFLRVKIVNKEKKQIGCKRLQQDIPFSNLVIFDNWIRAAGIRVIFSDKNGRRIKRRGEGGGRKGN